MNLWLAVPILNQPNGCPSYTHHARLLSNFDKGQVGADTLGLFCIMLKLENFNFEEAHQEWLLSMDDVEAEQEFSFDIQVVELGTQCCR